MSPLQIRWVPSLGAQQSYSPPAKTGAAVWTLSALPFRRPGSLDDAGRPEMMTARGDPKREMMNARGDPKREMMNARGDPKREMMNARGDPNCKMFDLWPGGSLGSPGSSEMEQGGGQRPLTPSPIQMFGFLGPCLTLFWEPQIRPGRSMGSLGGSRPCLGRTGGHGRPLADFRKLPERVQSNFKINEKPWFLIRFPSMEVIWKLSGGSWAASGGP